MDPLAALSVGAGELGTAAGVHGLSSLVGREGRGLAHTSPQRMNELFNRVKKEYGLDVGYMHDPYLVADNAGYATREGILDSVAGMDEELNDPGGIAEYLHPSTRKALRKRIENVRNNVGEHGVIITGKHFKKPGTIEHELGHAIAANKGNAVERAIVQKGIPKWSLLYHSLPSHLAALIAGGKKGPLAGALVGGAAGLLTGLPTLYAEYSANKYGNKLVDKDKPQHAMRKAFATYLLNAVAPAAASGGLYGFLRGPSSKKPIFGKKPL